MADTDPITLAAQARVVIQNLHKQNNVVVRFKTNKSGFAEDELDSLDEQAPGHFKTDKKLLTLNLDALIGDKPMPKKLDAIEDFRLYPVLAGVAAHESGHARWSLWTEIPESIPNPEFDPFAAADEDGNNPTGPEEFPVSGNGKLLELAHYLEEPRIERIASNTFTKTWKKSMTFSAGHLILEQVEAMDENGEGALDSAVRLAILVGGRSTAGTLGTTFASRQAIKGVMDSAQKIIESTVASFDEEKQTEDPFHKIMGIINAEVFNNDHEDATPHLEAARQILKVVYPDDVKDPDKNPDAGGEGEEGEEGEEGTGMPGAGESSAGQMLKEMQDAMRSSVDKMAADLGEIQRSEEEAPAGQKQESGGHGSTLYKNPKAPQLSRYEQPNAEDRELYRRALEWMEKQIEPTVTETEQGQWLPVGGARLDVRSMVRDDLAGHRGSSRSDWNRVSETVKPMPPVKVAIMLDGSGSMSAMARPSARIAWAAANAAAMLPESRTVSVVYGNAAQVTQAPGNLPARQIAVSQTNGGTEEFIGAAKMVEDALWLDDQVEEGEKQNVLIIVVSDLAYGGEHTHPGGEVERQMAGFTRITNDWYERGYNVVVIGAPENWDSRYHLYNRDSKGNPVVPVPGAIKMQQPSELFR